MHGIDLYELMYSSHSSPMVALICVRILIRQGEARALPDDRKYYRRTVREQGHAGPRAQRHDGYHDCRRP